MLDTKTFLFFYFILLIRNNFKIMNIIRSIVLSRKNIRFCYLDAILIYYYMVLGLQADNAFRYVEFYWKQHSKTQRPNYITSNSVYV